MDINALLSQAVSSNNAAGWYILLLAFVSGILVSFTPCVYPMIPITAGILQAQAGKSLWYNFLCSLAYITGIALVYASLGYLSASTSIVFGKWLANPLFISIVVLFFLYLAGAMFSFYELHIPSFLQHQGSINPHGSVLNSFFFGIVSGTVASPCLTPALALLLGIVSKQANPLFGFFTLFSFSLGMGILLLIIGTFSSTLTMLPRAGEWMNHIKQLFGFLMLATCIYFVQPFISSFIALVGYAAISTTAATYYFTFAHRNKISIILGIFASLMTIFLITMLIK